MNGPFATILSVAILSIVKSRGSKSDLGIRSFNGRLEASVNGYEGLMNLLHFAGDHNLRNIKSLDIENYEMEWLPNDIFLLENLEELWIMGQPITELPDNISDFIKLNGLYATDAALEKIPDTLFDIKGLDFVKLAGNNITKLPENTWKFQGFDLVLFGNPIAYPSDVKILEWDRKGFWQTEHVLRTKYTDPKAVRNDSELRRF